ncbi:MAG: DUF350 domain-containing protein [Elusimicrobiota bacterium]|nr:DUF350 domain-containing protein [Elusimicrobiota bacterium]
MFTTRLMVSTFEFLLAVIMTGLVIVITYKIFVRANPDFDMEEEIKKGNVAVGILMAAILFSASMILHKGMESVVSMFRLYMSAPADSVLSLWKIALISLGHLTMSMVLAVITISVTLRLFGRLDRELQAGKELQKGNVAVGVLLAGVVLVAALYVGEGVSSISKALVPQPSIGQIEIME